MAVLTTKRRAVGYEPNPVLVKELRARFRGPRAFTALTAFLIVLTGFAWFAYSAAVQAYGYSSMAGAGLQAGSQIGRGILMLVLVVEAMFLAFIAPALTADSISGEIERQTWELLRATPLSGWSILVGKVGAAFGYVLLLAFSALPVMSLAFLFGGAGLSGVLLVQLSMISAGLLYLAIGAFCSSLARRTGRATVLSYGIVGLLLILPFALPTLVELVMLHSADLDWWKSPRWWALAVAVSPPLEAYLRFADEGPFADPMVTELVAIAGVVFRLVLSALLLLVAGGRIRGLGWQAQAALIMLVAVMLFWLYGMGHIAASFGGIP